MPKKSIRGMVRKSDVKKTKAAVKKAVARRKALLTPKKKRNLLGLG